MCGVATVYRKEINFSVPPSHNDDWLICLGTIDEKKETEFFVIIPPRKSMLYYYNDENISEVVEDSYEGAKIIIDELDKVSDMDAVLKYILKYNPRNVSFCGLLNDAFHDEEGLYYARKEYDFAKIEKVFEDKLLQLKNSGWSDEEKRNRYEEIITWQGELKEDRESFINNAEAYEQGMRLLEEHYNTNVDKLIGYGLTIQKKK